MSWRPARVHIGEDGPEETRFLDIFPGPGQSVKVRVWKLGRPVAEQAVCVKVVDHPDRTVYYLTDLTDAPSVQVVTVSPS